MERKNVYSSEQEKTKQNYLLPSQLIEVDFSETKTISIENH